MKERRVDQVKWGVILAYATLFFNILVSLLYTPVMLRILGSSEHGLYSTVSSTLAWLSLLNLGLNSSYIRFFMRYSTEQREDKIANLNGMFLLIFTVLGLIALVCGLFISNHLHLVFAGGLSEQEYRTARILAKIVTVEMAIGFPATVFNSIIRAREHFAVIHLVNLFQCIASPLITLPLLLMGYGSVAMVTITTLVNAAAYSFYVIYCFGKIHAKFRFGSFDVSLIKEIAAYSGVIAINSLINQVNNSLDKVLLARFVNTACVSVYTIGFSLYTYYSSFSSAIMGNLTPRVHRLVAENYHDKQRLRDVLTVQFIKFGRVQLYIQMLMLTGIIFFGKPFVAFWAGAGYENAYYVAVLLSVSASIPLCQNVGIEIQRAQNKHQFRTALYVVMTVINIVLTVILCRIYGEIGAAVGTAIATVVVDVIVMNIYYHQKLYIDIPAFWKSMARAAVGVVVPVGYGLLLTRFFQIQTLWQLIVHIGSYSLVYCASIWFISMNHDEKAYIIGSLKKR